MKKIPSSDWQSFHLNSAYRNPVFGDFRSEIRFIDNSVRNIPDDRIDETLGYNFHVEHPEVKPWSHRQTSSTGSVGLFRSRKLTMSITVCSMVIREDHELYPPSTSVPMMRDHVPYRFVSQPMILGRGRYDYYPILESSYHTCDSFLASWEVRVGIHNSRFRGSDGRSRSTIADDLMGFA